MRKIIKNAIQCNLCGDIIESTYRHDFAVCKCGCCSVDGGLDYLRRGFTYSWDDFTELSILEDTKSGMNDVAADKAVIDRGPIAVKDDSAGHLTEQKKMEDEE